MIPSTKQPTDEIEEIIEKATSGLSSKIDKLEKTIEESKQKPREENVDSILTKIRAKQEAAEKIKSEKDKVESKKDDSKEHNHEDILCPGCHKGHIHKMIGDGLKVKCTGDGCGDEYIMVPIQPDHECKTCKFPIKKPKEGKNLDACPNCGNKTAVKLPNVLTFDFNKFKVNK